ncbi:MAG TPA: bifunctional hydroxymethylpyrimidine kinase/phosphomethylpyrimidine kinase [Acidimicrobiales bacterium]
MTRPAGRRATTPPVALTIAGSDSGAGAGIQADLKAMSALGVFATTVVTAVTAQNSAAVTAVHPVPADVVDAQISAVLDDFDVAATKTGMLATTAIVRLVARRAGAGHLPALVVDPVMVASSGRRLLDDEAVDAYRHGLVPHALVVTPNLFEAAILAGVDPLDDTGADVDAMADLAARIHRLGATWVLVKGGHLPGVHAAGPGPAPDRVADVLFDGTDVTVLEQDRVTTRNNHGTGCSLASATAALLASGHDVPAAVARAKAFVHQALESAAGWDLGHGHGPLDPFGWSRD